MRMDLSDEKSKELWGRVSNRYDMEASPESGNEDDRKEDLTGEKRFRRQVEIRGRPLS